jgi:isoprenylcysteine carboxyl methyltransferase (ICMT) family protein YpbQ
MGELVGVAMMTDARVTGPVAVVSFAFVLWRRIAFEERVLRDMRIS